MTDIEMLPLPAETEGNPWVGYKLWDVRKLQDYARANMEPLIAEIEALRAEVEKLRELCGCAYQMAGYHDAPVEWLDALGDAGDGTPLDEWRVQAKDLSDVLLPYQPDNNSHEDAEIERLRAEVAAVWSVMPSDARYLDPPDGGDVPLHEQVRRMAVDAARAELAEG